MTVLSFGLGNWKVLRMTPWIKYVEESKKFLTLHLLVPLNVVSVLIQIQELLMPRRGVEAVSALVQRQEMMLLRRNHDPMEDGGEEEAAAKAAEEAVRLPRIPHSRHSRTMSSSLTLGTRMRRAETITSGRNA